MSNRGVFVAISTPSLIAAAGYLFFLPKAAQAIPPPDVIANVGSQLSQLFGVVGVVLSISIGALLQFSRGIFSKTKLKSTRPVLVIALVSVFVISGLYVAVSYHEATVQRDYEKQVAESLARGIATAQVNTPAADPDAYFTANANLPISISNEDFSTIESTHPFTLDARENEEYDIGHYPNSTHIRFADLLNGDWQKLPTDQTVYVFCWSGIRGKMVADFLRTKNIVARYFESGADGWVKDGGTWDGEIAFSSKYSADQYKRLYNSAEVHAAVDSGTLLVDTRQKADYDKSHIGGSINISALFTPSVELAYQLANVAPTASIITVCNDFVSCFDAKIVGVRLEALGHTFLGRYSTPWDY
jgi:rhodanese-related sulfurtransferase